MVLYMCLNVSVSVCSGVRACVRACPCARVFTRVVSSSIYGIGVFIETRCSLVNILHASHVWTLALQNWISKIKSVKKHIRVVPIVNVEPPAVQHCAYGRTRTWWLRLRITNMVFRTMLTAWPWREQRLIALSRRHDTKISHTAEQSYDVLHEEQALTKCKCNLIFTCNRHKRIYFTENVGCCCWPVYRSSSSVRS